MVELILRPFPLNWLYQDVPSHYPITDHSDIPQIIISKVHTVNIHKQY